MTKFRSVFALGLLISSQSAFAERPMRGTYSVPMPPSPDGSPQFNTYDVKFHSDNYSTTPRVLNFPLPAGLIGKETWVSFEQDPQLPGQYRSSDGSGKCLQTGRTLECQFHFNQISTDLNTVESFWTNQGAAREELLKRLEVSQKFGGEPIGVLTYELRGRDRRANTRP